MRQFAQQGAMQFAQKAAEQRRAEQDRQRLMGILQNSTPQQAIAAGVPVDFHAGLWSFYAFSASLAAFID